jgi:hypothetical protein
MVSAEIRFDFCGHSRTLYSSDDTYFNVPRQDLCLECDKMDFYRVEKIERSKMKGFKVVLECNHISWVDSDHCRSYYCPYCKSFQYVLCKYVEPKKENPLELVRLECGCIRSTNPKYKWEYCHLHRKMSNVVMTLEEENKRKKEKEERIQRLEDKFYELKARELVIQTLQAILLRESEELRKEIIAELG